MANHKHPIMLHGVNVATNSKVALALDLMRSLSVRAFDDVSVGSRVSVAHYRRDLAGFTRGHGGYFSPQLFVEAGPALSFQTAPARTFLVTGDISAGIAYAQEKSPSFSALSFVARHPHLNYSLEPSVSAELGWVWRLGGQWQMVGGTLVQKDVKYNEWAMGLALRFVFPAREGVVSDYLLLRFRSSVTTD